MEMKRSIFFTAFTFGSLISSYTPYHTSLFSTVYTTKPTVSVRYTCGWICLTLTWLTVKKTEFLLALNFFPQIGLKVKIFTDSALNANKLISHQDSDGGGAAPLWKMLHRYTFMLYSRKSHKVSTFFLLENQIVFISWMINQREKVSVWLTQTTRRIEMKGFFTLFCWKSKWKLVYILFSYGFDHVILYKRFWVVKRIIKEKGMWRWRKTAFSSIYLFFTPHVTLFNKI